MEWLGKNGGIFLSQEENTTKNIFAKFEGFCD